MWTKEEISVLCYCSEILSMFLLKHREQERTRAQAEDLRTILENQNQWIYIIDPKTHALQYLNDNARRISANAKIGSPCYRALFGRSAPCAGCPAALIPRQQNACALLAEPHCRLNLWVEATAIQWQNKACAMVTCRKMPDTETLLRMLRG